MTPPDPHPLDAALAAHAAREQARVISPPPGFVPKVTAAVLGDRRWWPKWVVGGGVLAGLLLAGGITVAVWPKPQPAPPPPPVLVIAQPPAPRIDDTLSDAGYALAKLTLDATDKATPPALLPPVAVKVPPKPVGAFGQPVGATFAAMPSAARSGFEPVTGRTKKAFGAMLRDAGLKAE